MATVEIRLTGTVEDCATVLALLSAVAPIEVNASTPTNANSTHIYAVIHTRRRDNP